MRLKTLDLSPELFVEFSKVCKDGPPRRLVVKDNPLPDDAKIVRVGLRDPYEPITLRLFIESETFDEVPEGAEPPELPLVVFTTEHEECSAMVA